VSAKKRDYKAEYKKFQSSTKAKKYRAELNKYNRKKGTYGNGDGKDASHKGGKIVGFESQSKNRGRAEKSRLKKEAKLNENPAAIAAAQRMVVQAKAGKKVSVNTARQSSYAKKDPSAHNKAKSMWQRIKDRFAKKEMLEATYGQMLAKKGKKLNVVFVNGKPKVQIVDLEPVKESVVVEKLKLTKDKPKKITNHIWSAPKRILTKREWLRIPDMRKIRKNGVDYVATSIGPNRTEVFIPVVFESVSEAINHPKVQKQANQLAKVLKNVVAAAKKDDRKLARKLVGNIYDIYNDLDWTIQRDLRYKESVNESRYAGNLRHATGTGIRKADKVAYDKILNKIWKKFTNLGGGFVEFSGEEGGRGKQYLLKFQVARISKKRGKFRDWLFLAIDTKTGNITARPKGGKPLGVLGNIKNPNKVAQALKDWSDEDLVFESVNEAKIKDIEQVLKKRSAKKIDGMYMDMTTANAIMTVYKALNTSNRKKFEKLPLKKMVDVTWKLVK